MTNLKLGRLERIELRNIWLSEAVDFTPWLARPENIALLGETLGIDLEVEAQEKAVGPFRADILCKDTGTDRWVLIENQLEKTDHVHLGQLLTYASGLEAVTIVWVAAKFTEEHRSTLDWLNRITDESFRFFGLEVELWKIGSSPAAPKFNPVAKPNNWSQSVARAARAIDETVVSPTKLLQREYWGELNVILDAKKGPVAGNKKPQAQSWMSYPIGRSGMWLAGAISIPKKVVRAELYLSGPLAKGYFHQLLKQKDTVEKELGYALAWEELPQGQDSRISYALSGTDFSNRTHWAGQQEFLAKHLNDFHRVFFRRVATLERPEDAEED